MWRVRPFEPHDQNLKWACELEESWVHKGTDAAVNGGTSDSGVCVIIIAAHMITVAPLRQDI